MRIADATEREGQWRGRRPATSRARAPDAAPCSSRGCRSRRHSAADRSAATRRRPARSAFARQEQQGRWMQRRGSQCSAVCSETWRHSDRTRSTVASYQFPVSSSGGLAYWSYWLLLDCLHRINLCGLPRRNRNGEQRHDVRASTPPARARASWPVTPNSIVRSAWVTATVNNRPGRDPERNEPAGAGEHEPHQIGRGRAESDADAELSSSIGYQERQQAVETERGQRQRGPGKHGQEARVQTWLVERRANDLVHATDTEQRTRGIEDRTSSRTKGITAPRIAFGANDVFRIGPAARGHADVDVWCRRS